MLQQMLLFEFVYIYGWDWSLYFVLRKYFVFLANKKKQFLFRQNIRIRMPNTFYQACSIASVVVVCCLVGFSTFTSSSINKCVRWWVRSTTSQHLVYWPLTVSTASLGTNTHRVKPLSLATNYYPNDGWNMVLARDRNSNNRIDVDLSRWMKERSRNRVHRELSGVRIYNIKYVDKICGGLCVAFPWE